MLSKTDGNSPTLCISRGRVYAHMRACADKQEEACTHKGIAAAHRKKQVDEPFPTRRNNRNTVKLIRNQGHFFKERKEKPEKIRSSPPEKISDFSDLFPWNGQFYVIRRTKIFQESPLFANRRTKISQETASFMTDGRRKNEPGDHFSSPG